MIEFFKKWKLEILSGIILFLLALFLRTYNLTLIPVFGDEAIYIRWSQVMNAVPSLRFLPLSDGKQPLFMWILMFLLPRFSDPLWIARMISVFAGIGTMVGIFVLTVVLIGRSGDKGTAGNKKVFIVALISSFFWVISPFALFYDRLALVDSLLTFFSVWTFVLGSLTAKTLRLDFSMISGFFLGGALLTKSPGFIILALYPLTYIVSNWPNRKIGNFIGRPEFIHVSKLFGLTLITFGIGYLFYNILRLGDNFHMISIRNKDYVFPFNQPFITPFEPLSRNIDLIFDWLWRMGTGLIVVFALFTLLKSIKAVILRLKAEDSQKILPSVQDDQKTLPAAAFLFLLFLFPVLIGGLYARALAPRYILYALPFFYIFAAFVFVKLWGESGLLRKVLIFGLLVYAVQSLQFDYNLLTNPQRAALPAIEKEGFLQEWTSGYGIKEASEIILEDYRTNPTKKIVVGTEGYFGTLPDGLQIYLNKYPEITIIGVGIDLKEMPTSLVESRNAGNTTYLLINSTRLLFKPEEYNLELVAAYPKMLRKEGTRMYNLFGPQETLFLFRLR